MQDCYAGDVGDFGKYGLLRALCGDDLRLGVLWYRFESCDGGNDVDYLQPPRSDDFERCNPQLFRAMRAIVQGKRTIAAVEASDALPYGTVCFSQELDITPNDPWGEREQKRSKWLADGFERVTDAQVVFADPNTGLEIPSVGPVAVGGSGNNDGRKYAYYHDLQPHWEAGRSIIVYHHSSRSVKGQTVEIQVENRMEALRRHFRLSRRQNVMALRYHRGTSRTYLVVPAPEHAERLGERCRAFVESAWGRGKKPHFTLLEG